MTKIATLRPGEHFMFKGFECVCLDPNHPDGGLYSRSKIAQSAPEHGICRGGVRMSTVIDEDFGTICVCAVRYCFGRQTYMPSLVQDFVCRNFKYLNENELQVMVDDINFAERINQLGDERIDKPDWLKFRERINSELKKRKAEKNA